MMATLATKYDATTIEHYTIRWGEDLTGAQRGAIASEIERDRFRPSFRMVKPSELFVDETYQRPLSAERVWTIATTFTWSLFDPLWIADRKRRGTLYVVDGRHRLAAAAILGKDLMPAVPCQIRVTESVEEEARIFVELQEKRRKISSVQRFQAKLVYGDVMALDLQRLMSKNGFKVPTEVFGMENATVQNEITAIATLEAIYRAGGKSRVDTVLLIIRQAWDGVPPTTSAWMLRAINRLLERGPGKNPETLARKLKQKDPWGLIERGQRFAHSNEIPISEAMADVLLKVTE